MSKNCEFVSATYYDEHGDKLHIKDWQFSKTTRLSVWLDNKNDNYHVEFLTDTPRDYLVGILINLAHQISKGRKDKDDIN